MHRIITFVTILLFALPSFAQLRKMRIGSDSKQHISFSLGVNKFIMETPTLIGATINGSYTYFFHPRVGLRGQLQYSWTPDKEFKYHLNELNLSAQVVGNYYLYNGGRNESAQGSAIPERGYAFAGIGAMGYFSSHNNFQPGITMNIPVGTGFQWTINDDWGIGAEISYNFTITDQIDGVSINKFTDGYALLSIIATYKINGHKSYGGKRIHQNVKKKKKAKTICDPRHGCIRTFE